MNKNRIEGVAEQGERAKFREALVIKARRRRSGGCAVKECVLTRGYLASWLKGRRRKAERSGVARGEAARDPVSDEAGSPRHDTESTGSGLLHAVLTRENLRQAWKRVKANKGAAGVDGLDINQTARHLVPGRRAHDAVLAAHGHVQSGRKIVVDVDLEKFFDRVNHDILNDRLKKRIDDAGTIRLIRAYLNSGIMSDGVVLERYLSGWKAYFGLAQTPGIWRTLDEWLRHRLRAIQLRHWRRGSTIYRELINLGAAGHAAKRVSQNARCWWRNSAGELNRVLTIAYFDRLGLPVSHDLNFSNRPVRTRTPGGVGGLGQVS